MSSFGSTPSSSGGISWLRVGALVGAVIAVIAVIVFLSAATLTTPEAGQTCVIRNGGPFDNKSIRQVVPNGAGNSWTGMYSEAHCYPVREQQRLFTFKDGEYNEDTKQYEAAPGADAPAIETFSADGVRARIEGTIYLNTAFDSTDNGVDTLKQFDNQFGTREFNGKHVWDDGGLPNFLEANVEPILDSNFREVFGSFQCRELQPSCALVQQTANSKDQQVDPNAKSHQAEVQDKINKILGGDPATGATGELEQKLGHPYFTNVRFSLGSVKLPGVQVSIDKAQAAFADVSTAQAHVNAAEKDAQANEKRQQGYAKCSTCAGLDRIKAQAEIVKAQAEVYRAIPDSVQVFAPGNSQLGINLSDLNAGK